MRTSTRSADSGFGRSEIGHYSHSDTELRSGTSPSRAKSRQLFQVPRGGKGPDPARVESPQDAAVASAEVLGSLEPQELGGEQERVFGPAQVAQEHGDDRAGPGALGQDADLVQPVRGGPERDRVQQHPGDHDAGHGGTRPDAPFEQEGQVSPQKPAVS
jgi:hypothetical protein